MKRLRATVAFAALITAVPTAHCGNDASPARDAADAGGRDGGDAGTKDGGKTASGENGPCRSSSDCSIPNAVSVYCWNGGPRDLPFTVCGEDFPDRCQTDLDCADAGADLCVPENVCGGTTCGPKCTSDSDCGRLLPGADSCLANGHCGATPCATAGECPVDYGCVAKRCGAKCCTEDADCEGFCVNGTCASKLGSCVAAGSGPTPQLECTPGA